MQLFLGLPSHLPFFCQQVHSQQALNPIPMLFHKKWWSFVKTPNFWSSRNSSTPTNQSMQSLNIASSCASNLLCSPSSAWFFFRGGHRWQKNGLRYFHSCEDESKRTLAFSDERINLLVFENRRKVLPLHTFHDKMCCVVFVFVSSFKPMKRMKRTWHSTFSHSF